MEKMTFPVDQLKGMETPFYYYDVELLKKTLKIVKQESKKYGYLTHYALKANSNRRILEMIAAEGFGADCVSGNEVKLAATSGFPASKIVFAGVGKTDKEINVALDLNIFCFNAESIPELEVINDLAGKKGKVAQIALRINPNVDAQTHENITTGLADNKFGFNMNQIDAALEKLSASKNLSLIGIHFHIGSQIENMDAFEELCERVNELQHLFEKKGINLPHINVGGGLGINYADPDKHSICNFEEYYAVFNRTLKVREDQVVHFELGRSIVAQCGTLISKVVYVKEGEVRKFAILDAGFTDLIRPALYQAEHKIENLSSKLLVQRYDVVGPICESTDCFAKDYELNQTQRGDVIAIRSAGAYGEIMASQYNLRELPKVYFSDKI